MLDDLRKSSFYEEEELEIEEPEEVIASVRTASHPSQENFLGMTAQQRFILSLMLFMMVCVLGAFALVVTNSVRLPF